jgi:hypothetical protein
MRRNTIRAAVYAPPPDDPPLPTLDDLPGEQRGILRLRYLRLFRARAALHRRQLQHCYSLARNEPRHHHDLTAREFQGIVMDVRIVHLDLAETGHAMRDARPAEHAERTVKLDVVIESELGAGEQADRHIGLANFGKAPRDRFHEIG